MKVADVLRRECVVAGAELPDKEAALAKVVETAKRSSLLESISDEDLLSALKEREEMGSTGIGQGVAIPHCRLDSVEEFVVGLITVPDGVDFEALDDEAVRLVIFIVGPEGQTNHHIRLLSSISQTLLLPGAMEEIVSAKSDESLAESFLRRTHADIDVKEQTRRNLFMIFVQDDQRFEEILQAVSGIESASVMVSDVENASAYLRRMPLFAGFWDKQEEFTKVIIAVIVQRLRNETLRRIESITGNLAEQKGVMVAVTELYYAAGSI